MTVDVTRFENVVARVKEVAARLAAAVAEMDEIARLLQQSSEEEGGPSDVRQS